jgi:hypothetical protein
MSEEVGVRLQRAPLPVMAHAEDLFSGTFSPGKARMLVTESTRMTKAEEMTFIVRWSTKL